MRHSYGPHSYGLHSYCLHSYGLHSYGPHSYSKFFGGRRGVSTRSLWGQSSPHSLFFPLFLCTPICVCLAVVTSRCLPSHGHARMHAITHARARTGTHAHTHARTHACTHASTRAHQPAICPYPPSTLIRMAGTVGHGPRSVEHKPRSVGHKPSPLNGLRCDAMLYIAMRGRTNGWTTCTKRIDAMHHDAV